MHLQNIAVSMTHDLPPDSVGHLVDKNVYKAPDPRHYWAGEPCAKSGL